MIHCTDECLCHLISFSKTSGLLKEKEKADKRNELVDCIGVSIFVDILVELTNTVSEAKIQMTLLIGASPERLD